ncbi:MAG: sugar phosphate nucleotidyltransferase [Acidimicrobiia bacterium]
MILAGGKGSRLAPFTFTIPKPLVPIGDIPIIELLIRQLASQGFTRVTISVGHLAGLIQSFCGDGSAWGIPIDYVYEDTPLGTVGSLALVDDFSDDRVLVVNGDTLTDMSFADAYTHHDAGDAATIFANQRTVEVDFGVLEVDDSGLLAGYSEKPSLRYLVSMGTNVLNIEAVRAHIARGERLDMPALIERFRTAGLRVAVRKPDAYWLDLGRIEDLETGSNLFTQYPGRFIDG